MRNLKQSCPLCFTPKPRLISRPAPAAPATAWFGPCGGVAAKGLAPSPLSRVPPSVSAQRKPRHLWEPGEPLRAGWDKAGAGGSGTTPPPFFTLHQLGLGAASSKTQTRSAKGRRGPPERRAEGKLCTQASHGLGWEQGLGSGILSVVLKPGIREISRSENCL